MSIKERPIILNTQEVNAMLAGDKTQHRVPIKMRYGSPDFLGSRDCNKSDPSLWGWDNFEDSEIRVLSNEPCPFGAIGDRLWVQEDWTTNTMFDNHSLDELSKVISINYLANGKDIRTGKFRPAKDMHRAASRVLLEITGISIERVQDITIGDALKEGFGMNFAFNYWALKHGEAAWLKNPWVWVIEFKVVEPSEVKL